MLYGSKKKKIFFFPLKISDSDQKVFTQAPGPWTSLDQTPDWARELVGQEKDSVQQGAHAHPWCCYQSLKLLLARERQISFSDGRDLPPYNRRKGTKWTAPSLTHRYFNHLLVNRQGKCVWGAGQTATPSSFQCWSLCISCPYIQQTGMICNKACKSAV